MVFSSRKISYDHSDNELKFTTAATFGMRLSGSGGGKLWVGNDGSDPTEDSTSVAGLYLANNVTSFMSSFNVHPLAVHNSTSTDSALNVIDIRRKGASVGTITGTNDTTAYNTSSDYRKKENETAITDSITRIKQLKPYRFNFKSTPYRTLDGFFAHEVSGIVPEAVYGEKDAMAKINYTADDVETQDAVLYTADDDLPEGKSIGDIKTPSTKQVGDFKEYHPTEIATQGLDQAKLVPILVAAVKELITRVETLEG